MISTKKLIKMARKWQKIAAAGRRRISWQRPTADKGHFVRDFQELFRLAEEEFGIASSRPIVLPCDSTFMEYAISMIQRHVAQDLEKALIISIGSCSYSVLNEHQEQTKQHTKKLIKMAKKWQNIAAASRKRISWSRAINEGHFVVYTSDKRRFMIPLTYLKSKIFTELFRMAEEEFGIASNKPIILPCDSVFMEYTISMMQRHLAKDLEEAVILSLASCKYSSFSCEHHEQSNHQFDLRSIKVTLSFPQLTENGY
ncbi:Auxin-responsive protein SAUR64 [Bienertia sinuspersici]